MNRLFSSTATIALCAFCASACASMETGDATPAATADSVAAGDNQPINTDADTASILKDLPSDLPGEIERAHVLRLRGDYDDASKSLAQIMMIAPDDPRVVSEYGKTLLQAGRAQEAVGFLKRAAQISPNDWTVYSAMGVALDQAGDHASAKLAYQRALSIKPGEPSVLNNLAVSRMLAGDVSGAKTILAKASTTGTDQPKIANNLAAMNAMQKPAALAPVMTAAATQKPVTPPPTPMIQKPVTQAALPPAVSAAPQKLASTDAPAIVMGDKKPGLNVVMQAVPIDPLAGPVASRAPHKLAEAKPAKKPVTKFAAAKPTPKIEAPAPALRTASDAN